MCRADKVSWSHSYKKRNTPVAEGTGLITFATLKYLRLDQFPQQILFHLFAII